MIRHLAFAAAVALTLAGCGSSSTPAISTPSSAQASALGSVPSNAPASARAQATVITDAAPIMAAFKAANLPVAKLIVYTDATDPNHLLGRPNGYVAKTAFADARVKPSGQEEGSVDLGGSVEVFADSSAAVARGKYIQGLMKASPMLGSEYDYAAGPVLLRMSHLLTPTQAKAYAAALSRAAGSPASLVTA